MKNIEQEARKFYFNGVKNIRYRNNFDEKLTTYKVFDKRSEGYYCFDCGKFTKKSTAFVTENQTIFPSKAQGEIWIVNTHYDGCSGWS